MPLPSQKYKRFNDIKKISENNPKKGKSEDPGENKNINYYKGHKIRLGFFQKIKICVLFILRNKNREDF